ncbi:MAG: hypothetical protein QM773_13030 [Hyphomonadaceae bacterium]
MAGSVAVHAVAGVFVMGAIAVSAAKPEAETSRDPRREKIIEIALMAESLPLPAAPKPGAPRPATKPSAPTDAAPPLGKPGAKGQQEATPADTQAVEDGVSFGAPADGLARGLASVSGSDPCKAKHGPKPRECGADWAAKGNQASLMPTTKQEKAQYYAEYMPKCPWNVGCEGGEWISTNGTRSVGRAAPGSRNDHGSSTPMAAGAAGLGGLHDSVGRLGFNPDHFDRGFGD